jgi:hypothetical protein
LPCGPLLPQEAPQKKKARQPSKIKGQAQRKKPLMLIYLIPPALISFKVGCRVEHSIHRLQAALKKQYFPKWNILKYFFNSCAGIYKIFQNGIYCCKCLPKIVAFTASTTLPYQVPRIHFDTDSFVIGVDTFASITLGNHPDQFEDLKEHDNMEVKGIQGGLSIKGTGTFKFHIKDDEGGVHLIKIPNSKYVPNLKVCLLSPHHRAQEAKDHHPVPKGTKMDTNIEALTLIWNQQKY